MNRNSEDSGKFLRYSTIPNNHLDYYIRENYLELLEDCRKRKIETSEFCITFEKRCKLTSDIIDIL